MFNKKKLFIPVLLLPLLFSAGCKMGHQGESKRNDNTVRNVSYKNTTNNTVNRHPANNKMTVAKKAAKKVAALKEIKDANVIVTGNSAFVAVVMRNGSKGDVPSHLKTKIADRVKSTDKHIKNVYISANPDFVARMKDYGDKIKKGHPVTGLFTEFSKMVRRVFPDYKG